MTLRTIDKVQRAASIKVLFLPHAVGQMGRAERMITTDEILDVLRNGHVIEDYPDDPRGHSGLLLGFGIECRPIHVVCAPKTDYLAIITLRIRDGLLLF